MMLVGLPAIILSQAIIIFALQHQVYHAMIHELQKDNRSSAIDY
jgi:hypothetical protein